MNRLPDSTLLRLTRWNTPTIYNGWEALTKEDRLAAQVNEEQTADFMPEMGPMAGYAVTLTISPGDSSRKASGSENWDGFRRFVAGIEGPKIIVVQDLDKPRVVGSLWGEVGASAFRALGCIGTITDGAVRDVDEMKAAGFKALARRLCVGHAYAFPWDWGIDVEVFGTTIHHGQLIHADKHGFIAIPQEDEGPILEAAEFMDLNECRTVIPATRFSATLSQDEICDRMHAAAEEFARNTLERFGSDGEW